MDRIAGIGAGLKSLLSIRKVNKSDREMGPSPSGDYEHIEVKGDVWQLFLQGMEAT